MELKIRQKNSIKLMLLLLTMSLVGQSAYALPSYVAPLNNALASTALSCNACHVGATTKISATRSLVTAWNARATTPIATVDSDGDLFSNGIEVRMGNDINDVNSAPFGKVSQGIFVSNASSVTTAAATSVKTETLSVFQISGSDTILGAKSISPVLSTAGTIDIAYESMNILTVKVYQVANGSATELRPVTINSTGSISFATTSATPKLIVVGTASAAGGASLTTDKATVGGCLAVGSASLLAWWLVMLSAVGLVVYRKRSV